MSQEFAIETKGLVRYYGRQKAVDGLDLRVPTGALFGFLGLNGAGKSTTIRMLMGLIGPHDGTARVLGLDPRREGTAMKRRVGYVAEVPNFYPWMRVREICAFVAHYRRESWDWKRTGELMERFRLEPEKRIRELSKGQRAKVALLLALAFDPELLILDEPTSGLDPVARREFVEGVLAEYQKSGRTILVSSHLVNELAGLVDHVGILYEGRLRLSERTEDFLAEMHEVRVRFAEEAPAGMKFDGLLHYRARAREAVLSVRASDPEVVRGHLAPYRPESVEFTPMDLEGAFVEFIAGVERGAAGS